MAGRAVAPMDEAQPLPERVGRVLLNGLFGLGLIAREDRGRGTSRSFHPPTGMDALMFAAAVAIEAGQMMAFPFAPVHTVWSNSVFASVIRPISSVIMPASADVWLGQLTYRLLFAMSIAWVLLFISLSVSIAVAFVMERKQSEFALRGFRATAGLSVSILFLPVASILFRSYSCDAGAAVRGSTTDWLGAGIACDNVWRAIGLAGIAVLLLLFFTLAAFVAATFVDTRPGSPKWGAKHHGRIDVGLLAAKVLLTAIYNISPGAARSIGTVVTLSVIGALWFAAVYRDLPLMRPVSNALWGASASAFLWASTAMMVAQLMPGNDLSVVSLLGIPVAALAGGLLVLTEGRRIVSSRLADCRTVSHIVLWASARVHEAQTILHAAEGTPAALAIDKLSAKFALRFVAHADNYVADTPPPPPSRRGVTREPGRGAKAGRGGRAKHGTWQAATAAASVLSPVVADASSDGAGIATSQSDRDSPAERQPRKRAVQRGDDNPPPRPPRGTSGPFGLAIGAADNPGRRNALSLESDPEGAAEHRLGLLSAAEEAYRTAMKVESSGLALAAAARFYQSFSPHHQQEVDCIARLKAMRPAPDLAFIVFVRAIELNDASKSDGGLAPIDRVMFEQMADETRTLRAAALRSMVELWGHLEAERPDLWATLNTGAKLDSDIQRCDTLFGRMLRLNPESTAILRSYSGFLAGLGFDPSRAIELRNRADRIDEAASRQRTTTTSSVSLFAFGASLKASKQLQLALADASSPVVTVSASSSNRGEIVSVTPAAAKLLLAPRTSSLVGQNILNVVPPPFREFHQHMIDGFGRSIAAKSAVVGHEILVPVARRDGSIIPCNLTFDEAPPDAATLEPRLAAVFHPVLTAQEMIIFVGEWDSFRIASASRGALNMLSIDAGLLKERHVSLLSYLPSLDPDFVPFHVVADGRAEVRALRDAAMMADSGAAIVAAANPHSAAGRRRTASTPMMSQLRPSRRGDVRVRVPKLLSLRETAPIPIEFNGTPAAGVLAGSVQSMTLMGKEIFMLRFVPTKLVVPAGVPADGSSVAVHLEGATTTLQRRPSADDFDHGPEHDPDSLANLLRPQPFKPDSPSQSRGTPSRSPDPADQSRTPVTSSDVRRASAAPILSASSALPAPSDLAAPPSGAGVGSPVALPPLSHRGLPSLAPSLHQHASSSALSRARVSITHSLGPGAVSDGISMQSHASLPSPAAAAAAASAATTPLGGAAAKADSKTVPQHVPADNQTQIPFAGGIGAASSSGDSSSGGISQVNTLIRAVLRRNDSDEPETSRVRLALVLAAVAVGVATIAFAMWIGVSRQAVQGRAQGLKLATRRLHAFHASWAVANALYTNVSGASSILGGDRKELLAALEASVASMHSASRKLHDAGPGLGAQGATFDLTHRFSVVEPGQDGSSGAARVSQQSVAEAESFLFNALSTLVSMGPDRWLEPQGRSAFVTVRANRNSFRFVLEKSLSHRERDFALLLPALSQQIFATGGGFLVVVVLANVATLFTAVNGLWRHAILTTRLFVTFPAEAAGALRQLAAAQLEAADADLALAAEGADLVDADDSDGPDGLSSNGIVDSDVTGGRACASMQPHASYGARAGVTTVLEEDDDENDEGSEEDDESASITAPRRPGLSVTGGTAVRRSRASLAHVASSNRLNRLIESTRSPSSQHKQRRADDAHTQEDAAERPSDEALRSQLIHEADAAFNWDRLLKRLRHARRKLSSRRSVMDPLRRFAVSRGFVVTSLASLLVPALTIAVWLAVILVANLDSYQKSSGQASRIIQLSRAASSLDELGACSVMAMSNWTRVTETSGTLGLAPLPELIAGAEAREVSMRGAMNTLVFGGRACTAISVCEELPPLRDGSSLAASASTQLLLGDACSGVAAGLSRCHTVGGGVLKTGLLGATTSIAGLARQALAGRRSNINDTKGSVLDRARIQAVTTLTFPFVRDAFDRAADGLISSTVGVLAEGESVSETATWVFALVYMLITVVWLNSQVPKLAWPLRTSRRLVRFLPADLVLAVPSLRVGLRDVAAGAVLSTGSRRPCCRPLPMHARVAAVGSVVESQAFSSGRASVVDGRAGSQ